MATPYLCPGCKSNRTRFAILNQIPHYVKMDPHNGEVVQDYEADTLDAFHIPYNGSERRIQCGACGMTENEQAFIAMAQHYRKS
ncbi:DNA alkylation repair protein [Aneurinibacillus sp. REN35]|uniref:DNA alkylation repair protein n=1 Tax=Aneurinibacillus sp. REN35 TaxID=3237286 RepID=UPI00352878A3